MSGSRDEILKTLRWRLGRSVPLDEHRQADLERNLLSPRRNLIPARADLDRKGQLDLFVSMAKESAATVDLVANRSGVPQAVADYMAQRNLPTDFVMAPDPWLQAIPWDRVPLLSMRTGAAEANDYVSVTGAFAGIAETGTLMLASGATHPTALILLPDSHFVVLRASRIVGSYEDGWDVLRRELGAHNGALPRTVLFVTGPSRSADIEQTLQMGAHGPRRLHIIVVRDGGRRKAT